MRIRPLIIFAVLALTLIAPPMAGAARQHKATVLSIERAQTAIRRAYPDATLTSCHRVRSLQIDCVTSEEIREGDWTGWTLTTVAYAILDKHGRVVVTSSL